MMQTTSKSDSNYYVYYHINKLNGDVFYVGKGKGNRAYNFNSRSEYWLKYVNKYPDFEIKIVFENLTQDEAFEIEKREIDRIGRSIYKEGSLVNILPGGRCFPEEYLNFRKEKNIRYKRSDNDSKEELMRLLNQFLERNKNENGVKLLLTTKKYDWNKLTEEERYQVILDEHNTFIDNLNKRGGIWSKIKKVQSIDELGEKHIKKMYNIKEKRWKIE